MADWNLPTLTRFQYNICTCGAGPGDNDDICVFEFQYNICTCGALHIDTTLGKSLSYFNTTFVHVELFFHISFSTMVENFNTTFVHVELKTLLACT